MTRDALTALESMTERQIGRWRDVLDAVAGMLPGGAVRVLVEGCGHADAVAARLADRLTAAGRRCVRPRDGGRESEREPDAITIGAGTGERARPAGGWDVVIWLRTRRAPDADAENGADIVIDLNDTRWPVIRRVGPRLAGHDEWYVAESRAFFAPRAATWDARFGDDMPAYAAAVGEAAVRPGATVLDAGCGTGRALPALRAAAGPTGRVFAVDLTPEMLAVARTTGRAHHATLLVADARRLPFAAARFDAVFAAGLVQHLPDPATGLAELARVTRPGGRLIIFHPSGRAALAARHGRTLRPDEPLAKTRLEQLLTGAGWRLVHYDDAAHRFLALATRR
ncbi:class I SAM-dependent methyltransferase [Actinomadura litoris]|uniref:class I SAM-dependent methyltransferase n=1 Tax=Actinomadura litoris TaxID=2678616 RepID=UPI001FA710F4|nr:methyltransferase domain-containing protein [Actinomadura litoris]